MKKNIFLTESQIKVIKEWGRKKTEPIIYSMDDKLELVDDPNIKDGGNFAIKRNGKTYWISRSNTVSVYVFGYNENGVLHTLISKRGNKVAKGGGKWNVVTGYLDYRETLEHAAARECWEETGVKINEKNLVNLGTNSQKETVNTCFYIILDDTIENNPTSIENSEGDEVSQALWVPVNEIDKYNMWFGKKNIISIANRIKNKSTVNSNNNYENFLNVLKLLLDDNIINNDDFERIINIVKN